MKLRISALLGALALVSLAQAAQAGNIADDISARRKISPFYTYVDPLTGEVQTVYRPNYLVPSNDFEGGRYAGEYAHRRAKGQCVQDLGYGRFEGC
ncbi:MAG: hypothetical protein KJZ73_16670 [Pseudorhodoplanes sp.]|nr:hypothetical protein [Pseudorhodoplanes sp.]MCL4712876.1 hypothetical protein [Pseudorhodoplanes sp.]GIK79235.1 MAG: hypothetical protein BroJett024_03400 [Alphaproteobacteria bacterium]